MLAKKNATFEESNSSDLSSTSNAKQIFDSKFDPFSPDFHPDRAAEGKSHFQITFLFIPSRLHRNALCDLYAFCRLLDDISDEDGLSIEQRQKLLQQIRTWLKEMPSSPVTKAHPYWRRWAKEIQELQIPLSSLEGIIDGVAMDLQPPPLMFESWTDLNGYVHGVAGCVGEAVLASLGSTGARANEHALFMGRSLQYLNILRDLEEDARNHRTYVPQEFLRTSPPRTPDEIRNELFKRALEFRKQTKPYGLSCLPGVLMAELYFLGAKRYWLSGRSQRLTKFEKIRGVLKGLLVFVKEIF